MKTGTWQLALLVTLLIFFLLPTAYAQYNYWGTVDGLAIRQGDHIALGMSAIADDGAGNYVVAWSEAPNGDMDVHAQLYNFVGEPQWGDNGVLVAQTELPDQDAKVVRTSDGNWIIAWMDFAVCTDLVGVGRIFLMKYNNQGYSSWSEPVGPAGSCLSYAGKWKVMADQNGGVFVVAHGSQETQVRHIAPDGTFSWDQPAVIENYEQGFLQAEMTTDGCVVVMTRSSLPTNRFIGVQKVLPTGELVWTDNSAGLLLVEGEDAITCYPLVPMPLSNGNLVVGWVNNPTQEVIGIKLSSTGEMLWGEQPVIFTSHFLIVYPYAVKTLPDDCILISDDDPDRRFHKIDCSGDEPNEVWVSEPMDIGLTIEMQCKVQPDGSTWITWVNYDMDICSASLLADGSWRWNSPQVLGQWINLYHFGLCQHEGNIVTVWNHTRSGETGIAFQEQNVSTGTLSYDEPQLLQSGVSGDTHEPVIVRAGENVFIGWHDFRREHTADPYYQVVTSHTGDYVLPRNGLPLVDIVEQEGYYNTEQLQVVSDGSAGAIFLWIESDSESNWIRGQRIDSQGNRLWGNEGVTIFSREGEGNFINSYKVDVSEDGQITIAVQEFSAEQGYVQLISFVIYNLAGNMVTDGIIEPYSDGWNDQLLIDLLMTSDGDVVLYFTSGDGSWMSTDMHFARFHASGELVWNQMTAYDQHVWGMGLVRLEERREFLSLAKIGGDVETLVVHRLNLNGGWISDPEGTIICQGNPSFGGKAVIDPTDGDITIAENGDGGVTYRHFAKDGTSYLDDENGVVVGVDSWVANLLLDPSDGAYIFFYRFSPVNSDIYFSHVAANGEFVSDRYTTDGLPLVTALFDQNQLNVQPDLEGGYIAAWNDWRASLMAEPRDDIYAARFNDYESAVEDGEVGNLPSQFILEPAYPNPFNSSTTLRYVVPRAGEVRLAVYDILGREVMCLIDRHMEAGHHVIHWNGANLRKQVVSSGAYIVELRSGQQKSARKVLLLK